MISVYPFFLIKEYNPLKQGLRHNPVLDFADLLFPIKEYNPLKQGLRHMHKAISAKPLKGSKSIIH